MFDQVVCQPEKLRTLGHASVRNASRLSVATNHGETELYPKLCNSGRLGFLREQYPSTCCCEVRTCHGISRTTDEDLNIFSQSLELHVGCVSFVKERSQHHFTGSRGFGGMVSSSQYNDSAPARESPSVIELQVRGPYNLFLYTYHVQLLQRRYPEQSRRKLLSLR